MDQLQIGQSVGYRFALRDAAGNEFPIDAGVLPNWTATVSGKIQITPVMDDPYRVTVTGVGLGIVSLRATVAGVGIFDRSIEVIAGPPTYQIVKE